MPKSKDRRDRNDPPSRERSKSDRRPSKPDRDKPRSDKPRSEKPRSEKPRRDPSRPDRSKPGRDGDRPGWRDEDRSWPGADGPGRGDPDKPRGGKPGRGKPGRDKPGHDEPGAAKPRPSKPGSGGPGRGDDPTAGPGLLAPRPPARRRPGRDEVARWIEKRRGPGFHRRIDPARGPIDDPWGDLGIDRSDQVGALDRPTGPAKGDPPFREGRPRGSLPLDGGQKPDPADGVDADGKIDRRLDTRARLAERLAQRRSGSGKPGDEGAGGTKPAADGLALGDRVGDGRPNRPDDVRAVKQALAAAGRFPNDPKRLAEPMIDRDLVDGLIDLQKDRGLKVDGWLAPGGETEKVLRQEADKALKKSTKQASGRRPPQSNADYLELARSQIENWRRNGWTLAADLYEHYLDGNGEDFIIEADRALSLPGVGAANEKNLERFVEFTTNPQFHRLETEGLDQSNQISERIDDLSPGESIRISDHFEREIQGFAPRGVVAGLFGNDALADRELGLGNFHLRSDLNAEVFAIEVEEGVREVRIEGDVLTELNDNYDFDRWTPATNVAIRLKEEEIAENFAVRSEWGFRFERTIRIDREGNILSDSVDIEPMN